MKRIKVVVFVLTVIGVVTKNVSAWKRPANTNKPSSSSTTQLFQSFKVSVEEFEKDLTDGERTVTGVVRKASPAVALIASVLPPSPSRNSFPQRRRRRQRAPPPDDTRPRGQSLGSGSGFVVNSQGYIVTNFHVIERAYAILDMKEQMNDLRKDLVGNLTSVMPSLPHELANASVNFFMGPLLSFPQTTIASPKIFVKIAGQERKDQFLECRVVDVKPNLDVALLKITNTSAMTTEKNGAETNNNNNLKTVSFGSSTDLIVGQTVVAIGNPFGLDSSVSVGVVSALDREIRTQTSTAKGCIQTDAAINPGNSGGPLLNLQGQVVGVNTAIVTTSGTSSGVGFAVPASEVGPVIKDMIRVDERKNPTPGRRRKRRGYMGIQCWKTTTSDQETNNTSTVVVGVDENSPASGLITPVQVDEATGCICRGDRIIGLAGNPISSWTELERDLSSRLVGEEVAVTLQSVVDPSDQRIVNLKLQ